MGWPSICERHVVGWQGAREAAVVKALQPERCDTAKRPYAAATKPVRTGAEDPASAGPVRAALSAGRQMQS